MACVPRLSGLGYGVGVIFRSARRVDLEAVVALLADDPLGARREAASADIASEYVRAFEAIERDVNNFLVVGDEAGEIVACVQITLIPSLTRRGATRAMLEGVRVRSDRRGDGLGEALIRWAVAFSQERGASIVQLTTDKQRGSAHRFYERLGFEATHEGMKLLLT